MESQNWEVRQNNGKFSENFEYSMKENKESTEIYIFFKLLRSEGNKKKLATYLEEIYKKNYIYILGKLREKFKAKLKKIGEEFEKISVKKFRCREF